MYRRLERRGYRVFWLLGLTTIVLVSVTASTVLRFRSDAKLVEHSYEVLTALSALKASTSQAESQVRGYLVNGNPALLAEFEVACRETETGVGHVRALTADNPVQKKLTQELSDVVSRRIQYFRQVLRDRMSGATIQQIAERHAVEGRGLIAEIDRLTAAASAEETRLLGERRIRRLNTENATLTLCGLGGAVCFGLVYAGQRAIRNYRAMRDDTELELARVNLELEQRVVERTANIQKANAELQLAQVELSETASALERSNRELESFAYVASHDLQEPLRTITAFAQLLQRRHGHALTPEASDHLQTVITAAARMSELIYGVLEYSRVSRDPLVAHEPVRLCDALEMAKSNLMVEIQNTSAQITCGALPELRGDRTQLVRLLQNLIANSLKYRSPERDCKIRIDSATVNHHHLVSVSDNGIGFRPEYSENIFGMFKRLDRAYPGAGVGLAICRAIVERYGGRIWANGEEGKGATLTFTWPMSS